LTSRGWVDPVPDPLLLRKSGSAGNRTRDLCICTQKLWRNTLSYIDCIYNKLCPEGGGRKLPLHVCIYQTTRCHAKQVGSRLETVWIWEVNIDCWSGTDHTHWHVASCCLFPPGKFWIATQTRVHERPSTYLAIYYWPSSNHSPLYTATDSVVKQRTSTLFHIPEDLVF